MVGYGGGVRSIDTEVSHSFLFFQVLLRSHQRPAVTPVPNPAVSKMCDVVLIGLIGAYIWHVSVSPSDAFFLPPSRWTTKNTVKTPGPIANFRNITPRNFTIQAAVSPQYPKSNPNTIAQTPPEYDRPNPTRNRLPQILPETDHPKSCPKPTEYSLAVAKSTADSIILG